MRIALPRTNIITRLSRTVHTLTFPGSRRWSGASASPYGTGARLANARITPLLLAAEITPFPFGMVARQRISNLPFNYHNGPLCLALICHVIEYKMR